MACNVLIRIKRKRTEEPCFDSICLLEDSLVHTGSGKIPRKRRSLHHLTLSDHSESTLVDKHFHPSPPPHSQPRILLKRVDTVEFSAKDVFQCSVLASGAAATKEEIRLRQHHDGFTCANISVTSTNKLSLSDDAIEACNTVTNDTIKNVICIDLVQGDRRDSPSEHTHAEPTHTNSNHNKGHTTSGPAGSIITSTTIPGTIRILTDSVRVLSPASRLLEQGILSAMLRADFNDVSAALMQGAPAGHQIRGGRFDGFSALMAAAFHSNPRMVRRLLLKLTDDQVLASNAKLNTAYDMAVHATSMASKRKSVSSEVEDLFRAAVEVEDLLRAATAKATRAIRRKYGSQKYAPMYPAAHESAERLSPQQVPGLVAAKELITMSDHSHESDFVYDFYRAGPGESAVMSAEGRAADALEPEGKGQGVDSGMQHDDADTAANAPHTPMMIPAVLQVPGLRFLSATGRADEYPSQFPVHVFFDSSLHALAEEDCGLEYDSDWSDLADDEDPDSNDERFDGNDYPEDPAYDPAHDSDCDPNYDSDEDYAGWGGGEGTGGYNIDHNRLGKNANSCEMKDFHFSDNGAGGEGYDCTGNGTPPDARWNSLSGTDCYRGGKDVEDDNDDNDDNDEEAREEEEYEDDEQGALIARRNRLRPGGKDWSHHVMHRGNTTHGSSREEQQVRSLGVGKVLRPHVFSQNGQEQGQHPHTSQSLQTLWDGSSTGEDGGGILLTQPFNHQQPAHLDHHEQRRRVEDMRLRSGMAFAADVREFHAQSGLPKYGFELSDDEGDLETSCDLYGAPQPSQHQSQPGIFLQSPGLAGVIRSPLGRTTAPSKPALDSVAYDSELDRSRSASTSTD